MIQNADLELHHVSPCVAEVRGHLRTMLGEMLDTFSLDGVVLGQLFWGDVRNSEPFDTTGPGCDTAAPDWHKAALTDLAGELIDAIRAEEPDLPVWLTAHPFRAPPDPGYHYSGEQPFADLAELADGWMVIASDSVHLAEDPDPIAAEVGRLKGLLTGVLEADPDKRFQLVVSAYLADEWAFPAAFYDGLARRMRGLGVTLNLHSPISADSDVVFLHEPGYAFTRAQWAKIGDLQSPGETHNVLVLDRSGSMLHDGKIAAAHTAGRLYVDLVPDDQELLERIAGDTGGAFEYVYVGSSLSLASRLTAAYSQLGATVYGHDLLFSEGGRPKTRKRFSRRVAVPSGTGEPSIRVSWPKPGQPYATRVTGPTGAEAPAATRRTDPRHHVYRLAEPAAGWWTVELEPVGEAGEYVLMIFGDTPLVHRLDLEPVPIPAAGVESVLRARLRLRDDRRQLFELRVDAVVEGPDHRRRPVAVVDRDAGGDFILEHPVSAGGSYRLLFEAAGVDAGGAEVAFEGGAATYYGYPLDRDRDRMADAWEREHGLDPTRDDRRDDPDGDDLPNEWEYRYRSDPRDPDTDGDGVSDGDEHQDGSHPLRPRPGGPVLSMLLGATLPAGDLDRLFDGDSLLELGLEVPLSGRWSVNGSAGRYRFKPGEDVVGAAVHLRRHRRLRACRLFAELGAGWYEPDSFAGAFALSAGAGVDRAFGADWRGTLGVSFAHLFGGDDVEFMAFKIGLGRRF